METTEIQASLQSPIFSPLVEDGDRRCDLIWASPVKLHFFSTLCAETLSPRPTPPPPYFDFSVKFTEYYSIRLSRVRVKGE